MVIALLLALQLGTPPVYDRVILGGHVMDPASGLDAVRNIGLQGGRIAVITTHAIQGRDTIDARAASFTCSTAQAVRAAGLPRTSGAAKASNAVS